MASVDGELIRRWQDGEAAAFEALVRHWQQPVARFLARMVGPGEHVQDLCQEVFLRVFLAGRNYRHTGSFSTWLYRIALNIARDACRRRRFRQEPMNHEPVDDRDSADTECERQELALAVDQALGELPVSLREVLVLRHYLEMSFEHMSQLLEVPASTLKSRFAVVLDRLRQRLARLGWNNEESTP